MKEHSRDFKEVDNKTKLINNIIKFLSKIKILNS